MTKAMVEAAGGVMLSNERVVDLEFTDDVALLTDSWLVLVMMAMRMKQITQRYGININEQESEVLFIGRGE